MPKRSSADPTRPYRLYPSTPPGPEPPPCPTPPSTTSSLSTLPSPSAPPKHTTSRIPLCPPLRRSNPSPRRKPNYWQQRPAASHTVRSISVGHQSIRAAHSHHGEKPNHSAPLAAVGRYPSPPTVLLVVGDHI
ncbi:hypothetical protein Dimus_019769 [Dionaea muscipula]